MSSKLEAPDLTAAQWRALSAFSEIPGASLQEWAERLGVAYATVLNHRRVLVRKGYLTSVPGKARTTRLTDAAIVYINSQREAAR